MKLKISRKTTSVMVMALTIFLWQSFSSFAQGSVDNTVDNGIAAPSSGAGDTAYNFQADLFTGRFTYSVPITVAPARQGAEPKVTLGYNSASGNGWCGVGWSLDMGYIQRDTRHGVPIAWAQGSTVTGFPGHLMTNYLDYNTPLPQYDDSKGFVANFGGVSGTLIRVGATNQNPIIYRQQVDTAFLTYEYFTRLIIGKSSIKVAIHSFLEREPPIKCG